MGGAARNHGGTRGHGCSPLTGEKPNFNSHLLSDSQLLKIIKSNKINEVKQPSGQKVTLVKKLSTVRNELKIKPSAESPPAQRVVIASPQKLASNFSQKVDSKSPPEVATSGPQMLDTKSPQKANTKSQQKADP